MEISSSKEGIAVVVDFRTNTDNMQQIVFWHVILVIRQDLVLRELYRWSILKNYKNILVGGLNPSEKY